MFHGTSPEEGRKGRALVIECPSDIDLPVMDLPAEWRMGPVLSFRNLIHVAEDPDIVIPVPELRKPRVVVEVCCGKAETAGDAEGAGKCVTGAGAKRCPGLRFSRYAWDPDQFLDRCNEQIPVPVHDLVERVRGTAGGRYEKEREKNCGKEDQEHDENLKPWPERSSGFSEKRCTRASFDSVTE